MVLDGMTKLQFLQGALAIGREQGFLWDNVTDPHDDYLQRIYKKWGGDKYLQDFKTCDDALINFRNSLIAGKSRNEERFKEATRQISIDRLAIDIHVPIGNGREVVFKAEGAIPTDSTPDEKKYFYGILFQSAYQGWNEFKTNPPAALMPAPPAYANTATNSVVKQCEFTSIVTTRTKRGERKYLLKCDDYPIHGITVFPEVLSRAGIRVETLAEEAFIHGICSYAMKSDGESPEKVVHIQAFSNNG